MGRTDGECLQKHHSAARTLHNERTPSLSEGASLHRYYLKMMSVPEGVVVSTVTLMSSDLVAESSTVTFAVNSIEKVLGKVRDGDSRCGSRQSSRYS